jgi:hypothetical protein
VVSQRQSIGKVGTRFRYYVGGLDTHFEEARRLRLRRASAPVWVHGTLDEGVFTIDR